MRTLIMNVNTTASMTENMRASAAAVARPGNEIIGAEPRFGSPSVEGYFDSYLSAVGVLDRLATWDGPTFDGVVWAGFGEHGREGAQELLEVPVVTITEAAAMTACLLGHKYGVVTTLGRAIPQIEDQLRLAGLLDRCAAIVATDMGVLELEDDDEQTEVRLADAALDAIAGGAEVLCLGCGGMAGMARRLTERLGVPVVDGVEAATKAIEVLHDLGLQTSKVHAFAPPLDKVRTGWPISGPT